jgi:hypothetical protein
MIKNLQLPLREIPVQDKLLVKKPYIKCYFLNILLENKIVTKVLFNSALNNGNINEINFSDLF